MTNPSKDLKPDSSHDDEALLEVARTDRDPARRRDASAQLLLRYRDAVYAWCLRYTRDHERALDLSQDVMVTAWEKIGSFEGRSKLDRKSTRLNSSHSQISYAVLCLKKKL